MYEDEDMVDWSDGTINSPSPECLDPVPDLLSDPLPNLDHFSLDTGQSGNGDEWFKVKAAEEYAVPLGRPLVLAVPNNESAKSTVSRAQRARSGVHLNRREPSKEDYANFALYQANQKAYEATFFKNFIAHALHPNQIKKCFEALDFEEEVENYTTSVVANMNSIANKMIWNAHHRLVNLFSNDGINGAPFLDMNVFDKSVFAEFGPRSTLLAAREMNESWHRADANPTMVWHTPKEYPIGHHSSPLEEIDEVVSTLLRNEVFNKPLPRGRAARLPTTKKRKSEHRSRAIFRDEREISSQGSWLPGFPESNKDVKSPSPLPNTSANQITNNAMEAESAYDQPHIMHQSQMNRGSCSTSDSTSSGTAHTDEITRLEELANLYGVDALNNDLAAQLQQAEKAEETKKVSSWQTKLINDHKRRLSRRCGNPLQTVQDVPWGIRQVMSAAIEQGYRPTADDIDTRVQRIEAQEKHQLSLSSHLQQHFFANRDPLPLDVVDRVNGRKKRRLVGEMGQRDHTAEPSTKKRKNTSQVAEGVTAAIFLPPHPSGSRTLDAHQQLPTQAYMEPKFLGEKPVWRCGIKHAMGYYYIAGDRKNCVGCFTSVNENPKLQWMDFYMPSRSYYYQSAPGVTWRPSKLLGKARRSKHLSHNSIAKEAYWAAMNTGTNEVKAREIAVTAVEEHLRPKPRKQPIPEPSPSPEPDLGPHPSGSTTMEHSQDLPDCAYFTQREKHQEHAWRCEVNHALGRYYLSGDKRTCPGCGSNKTGAGRHVQMDFYMPFGVVVRQEAPGLSNWKPRKPYNLTKTKAKEKSTNVPTHNQMCSKKYFVAVEAGKNHAEALSWAVRKTDEELDVRQEQVQRRQQEYEQAEEAKRIGKTRKMKGKGSANSSPKSYPADDEDYTSQPRRGRPSLVPRGSSEVLIDYGDDDDEAENPRMGICTESAKSETIDSSSDDDESTSESDSE